MKIEKLFLTKENLLKIKEIDDLFYTDSVPKIEWYLERYNSNHYAYCLFDNEVMTGYIVSVPIKKELYDTITSGVLTNDFNINPTMFINESNYNYIVSCVMKEEYRYQGYGKLLMETLLKDLKGHVCCLTISSDGYRLASKFLELKVKINDDTAVFEK